MNRQQREELLDSINLLENSRDEYLHTYAGVSVHDRTVRSVQLRKALENVKRPFAQLCEKMKTCDWLYLPFDLPEPACVRDSELTYFGLPPKTLAQLIVMIAASIKKQNVTVLSICTRNLAVYEMMFGFWNAPQKDNLDERVAAITEAEEKTGELFDKAQNAYRDQDCEAMKLVYDMLFEPVDLGALQFAMQEISRADPLSPRQSFAKFAHEMETDYGLAKELYDCFLPVEEDRVVSSALDIYTAERHLVEEEIAEIRKGFPFNAAEVLSDPAKQDEYMMSLKLRAKQCENDTKQLKDTITELLRGTIHG